MEPGAWKEGAVVEWPAEAAVGAVALTVPRTHQGALSVTLARSPCNPLALLKKDLFFTPKHPVTRRR